ncbi:MAG: AtzG-like protein [Burkholderiaceae bacterium]
MEDATIIAYVDAACALHGLVLDADARARVIETFRRTAQLAAPLLEFDLPADMEPAHTFKA